jgi:WXXGXW repeat (2 copies)
MLALVLLAIPATASAGFGFDVFVGFAPPPLPVYEQPICPGEGYIWTPGYWAYTEDAGYYWVPGTWVLAPRIGYIWTPGYWG